MNEKAIDAVMAKIEAQQKGREETAVWAVGEQLKEICRFTRGAAELVARDLDAAEMSIAECEKKIKAFADKRHRKHGGNCAYVSPKEADGIIREFYGIPEEEAYLKATPKADFIDLDDFI